jgi:hypothetical protein
VVVLVVVPDAVAESVAELVAVLVALAELPWTAQLKQPEPRQATDEPA